MQAVQCHEFAALKATTEGSKQTPSFQPRKSIAPLRTVLSLDRIPRPVLSSKNKSSVLIRVLYAGVQYPDALQAQGLYQIRPPLPYIPSMDVTGIVVEVGE